MTIPEVHYVACFVEEGGVYSCGHDHPSVREAMLCIDPNGGSFVRAFDAGVFRSLDSREMVDFYESLPQMPWSSRYGVRGDALATSAPVCVAEGAAIGAGS